MDYPLNTLIEQNAHWFTVDRATGQIFGRKGPVGYLDRWGYLRIGIKGKGVLAHRVAWFLYHGSLPEAVIDHINGVKTDNRPENLRVATPSESVRNRKKYARTAAPLTSIYMGVSKESQKWAARITLNKKRYILGRFATEAEAARAYDAVARAYCNGFAVLNFPDEVHEQAFQFPSVLPPIPGTEEHPAQATLQHGTSAGCSPVLILPHSNASSLRGH